MEYDIRLEKFLDLMVEKLRNELGEEIDTCPVYSWLEETLVEVRTMNNIGLMKEAPFPELRLKCNNKRCVIQKIQARK